ncbi:prepilin peptidase [Nocardia spumae]|uniref:prepilin peptidase n=1 Tax=Nocardia spumae TaxID=2887190 RepID=UPI001D151861|nr:A24 family peptidase [Nocardia spumae]
MDTVPLIAYLVLIVWCAVLTTVDLRSRRLPDALTLPAPVVIVAIAALTGHGGAAAGGAIVLAVPYLLVHLAAPAACGAGDVKLALGTGAAAACGGASCWVWAAIGAPVLTAAAGAGVLAAARITDRAWAAAPVPHHVEAAEFARAGPSRHRRARCARRVLTGPITVPHGPAMCLATVAALWPTL